MMKRIQNFMRMEAQREASTRAKPRRGTISAYDPAKYAAKVILQPEGFETGFLPIGSEMVGAGWGLYCGPSIGDEVEVNFQEDGKGAAYIGSRFYGDEAPPVAVPSGEFWLIHKSGAYIKLTNDGKLSLADAHGSTLVMNNDGKTILVSNLVVNGTIQATGDITDRYETDGSSMESFRQIYNGNNHGKVQTGTGNTDVPNQQIED
jgi:uncharacterized protein involved in type VI secretion and phage assembly